MSSAGPPSVVIDLAEVDRGAIALVGVKGANLGELIRAGFPVPPGFSLTTAAYRRFVEVAGLDEVVGAAPAEAGRAVPSADAGISACSRPAPAVTCLAGPAPATHLSPL